MPVPLHCVNEDRDQRLQSLATNPVGGLPQNDQSLPHRLIVEPRPWPGFGPGAGRAAPQHSDRMFAVIARHGHEFVQDSALLDA